MQVSIPPGLLKTIMPPVEAIDCQIPAACAGMRLDQALAELLPAYSRSRLQQALKAGHLCVDGQPRRPRDPVQGGEHVLGTLPREVETIAVAQAIPLTILYEDTELLVIDKPAGLVAHPAAGNRDGTLVNALLHHAPELATLPRAGLVHRLDKDTSGLLVVARSLRAHTALVAQLQARRIERYYLAVVNGLPVAGGSVDAPVGRHPVDRQRMAVTPGGKPAVTHYRIQQRFRGHSLLQVKLDTGRTHQIRVHMASLGHPLVADVLYGGGVAAGMARQALHAYRLSFAHPVSGQALEFHAPLPDDMRQALAEWGLGYNPL